jgi:hypothetical protein
MKKNWYSMLPCLLERILCTLISLSDFVNIAFESPSHLECSKQHVSRITGNYKRYVFFAFDTLNISLTCPWMGQCRSFDNTPRKKTGYSPMLRSVYWITRRPRACFHTFSTRETLGSEEEDTCGKRYHRRSAIYGTGFTRERTVLFVCSRWYLVATPYLFL